jgi:hypothetical protein
MTLHQWKRREIITLFGGAVIAWPLAARAQQPERTRRIGVLMAQAADDPEAQARVAAFLQGLRELGWIEGRNLRLDYRWGGTISPAFAETRRSWSRLHPMSSSLAVAKSWDRCKRRPGLCRLCLRRPLIPSAPATSPAWPGRAATPLVLRISNTVSAGNGSRS